MYKQGNGTDSGLAIFISAGALHFEAYSASGLVYGSRVLKAVAVNSVYFAILSFNAQKGVLSGRLNGADMTSSNANTIGQLPGDGGALTGNSMGFVQGGTRLFGTPVILPSSFTGHIGEFMYFNSEMTWARVFELEDYFLPYYGL
jgi:hypothetical protein